MIKMGRRDIKFHALKKGRRIKYPKLQELLHTDLKEYHRQVEIINREKRSLQKRIYKKEHKKEINTARRSHRVQNKINNLEWLKTYLKVNKICCQRCGYNKSFEAIDGHHKNPLEKKSKQDHFSYWILETPSNFKNKIINNDILFLCSNCHRELHADLWSI
jgi:hypothetical protein